MNDFHVIAQMIEEESPAVKAYGEITDITDSKKKGGRMTIAIDSDKAQRVMQNMVRDTDDGLVILLMMIEKDALVETRERMKGESDGKY